MLPLLLVHFPEPIDIRLIPLETFTLDFSWSKYIWRLRWLRKDTPKETPNLTILEAQMDISIVVFPTHQVSASESGPDGVAIRAKFDRSIPFSIISQGTLDQLGLNAIPCQQSPVTDSEGVQHSPIGQVELRWHKEELGKSYPERFLVINRPNSFAILGRSAYEASNASSAGSSALPIGLHEQTAEEKAALEKKKLEVAQRREKEKQEQDDKEAEERGKRS
ncbi:MAG: hypothetical protein Q9204_001331 [Flavoplaca sp. TL-2023a]